MELFSQAQRIFQSMTSFSEQMDLSYSYGGSREKPLVRGVVPFQYDSHIHSCLQEALLERTERLLHSLEIEFDVAMRTFDTADSVPAEKLKALDIMIATVLFTTKNILVQSPGVHYAVMFTRIQEIFKRDTQIRGHFGNIIAERMQAILKPAWVDLRAIDNSFGRNEGEGFFVGEPAMASRPPEMDMEREEEEEEDNFEDSDNGGDESGDDDEAFSTSTDESEDAVAERFE